MPPPKQSASEKKKKKEAEAQDNAHSSGQLMQWLGPTAASPSAVPSTLHGMYSPHFSLNHLPLLTHLLLNRSLVVLNRIAEQDARLHAHVAPYRPRDPPLPRHPLLTSPSDENGTLVSLGTTVTTLGSPWSHQLPNFALQYCSLVFTTLPPPLVTNHTANMPHHCMVLHVSAWFS